MDWFRMPLVTTSFKAGNRSSSDARSGVRSNGGEGDGKPGAVRRRALVERVPIGADPGRRGVEAGVEHPGRPLDAPKELGSAGRTVCEAGEDIGAKGTQGRCRDEAVVSRRLGQQPADPKQLFALAGGSVCHPIDGGRAVVPSPLPPPKHQPRNGWKT